MRIPNFCINHPNRVAWYIANNTFYCDKCRDDAYKACRKEYKKRSKSRVDYRISPKSRIGRRDAATQQVM